MDNDQIGWSKDRLNREINRSHYNDGRAKSHVGFVNPTDFLHSTTPSESYEGLIKKASGTLDREKLSKESQSLFLTIENGNINGHEGRHRMAALAQAGHTSVPIAIHHSGTAKRLAPMESATFGAEHEGRKPITVKNLIPLHHDYADQINDTMSKNSEHFNKGGNVTKRNGIVGLAHSIRPVALMKRNYHG